MLFRSVAAAPPLFILTISRCGSAPGFLYCPFLVAAAPPLFILTNSRCGSAPDFYTDRQRHQFFTARISMRMRPRFLYCPFLIAAAPPLFILTNYRCGSAPAIYTDHFSLRQRHYFLYCPYLVAATPRFLYCPFLVAAAPPLFILTGSTMHFFLPGSPCGSAPAFYTARISMRQRPCFLY